MEYVAILVNKSLEENKALQVKLRNRADHVDFILFESVQDLILRAKQSSKSFTRIIISAKGIESEANLRLLHEFATRLAHQTTVVFWVVKGKDSALHQTFHNLFTSSMFSDAAVDKASLSILVELSLMDIGELRSKYTAFANDTADILEVGDFERKVETFSDTQFSYSVDTPVRAVMPRREKRGLLAFLDKKKGNKFTQQEVSLLYAISSENEVVAQALRSDRFKQIVSLIPDISVKRESYVKNRLMRFREFDDHTESSRLMDESRMDRLTGKDFMLRLIDAKKYGNALNLSQSGFRNKSGKLVVDL